MKLEFSAGLAGSKIRNIFAGSPRAPEIRNVLSLENYNNPTVSAVPDSIDAIKALMSSPLLSFVRTGFDGDTVIIYMRPERVHGLKGVKLELLFDVPDEGSVTAAVLDKSCEKRNIDSVASARGAGRLDCLAALAGGAQSGRLSSAG